MSRITLRYSDVLIERNTFYLLASGDTIRANIAEAESSAHTVELALRFRKRTVGLKVRPLDGDLADWLVESSVVHKDLARAELHLTKVPSHCAWALLEL